MVCRTGCFMIYATSSPDQCVAFSIRPRVKGLCCHARKKQIPFRSQSSPTESNPIRLATNLPRVNARKDTRVVYWLEAIGAHEHQLDCRQYGALRGRQQLMPWWMHCFAGTARWIADNQFELFSLIMPKSSTMSITRFWWSRWLSLCSLSGIQSDALEAIQELVLRNVSWLT